MIDPTTTLPPAITTPEDGARPARPIADDPMDPERITLINRARDEWITKLIDTTRRNNLLYFRALKVGTLEFTDADPSELATLLRGDPVRVMELVGDDEHERREEAMAESAEGDEVFSEALEQSELEKRVALRLREIRRKALENAEEKGLETLHLTIGMATWPIEDGGRPPEAAVILLPVAIQTHGTQERAHTLRRRGDVQINPVLLHAIETSFGIQLSGDDLLAGVPGVEEESEAFDPAPIFERLENALTEVKGFAIETRVVLGNFTFAKMAMVQDLRENADVLYRHDMIGAIAGHSAARDAIRPGGEDPDPHTFDREPPDNEHLILDADSSQQGVIAQVLSGRNGVIQGPPGTGKSQTIANLVAELAARKNRVLFVAEKRAALEVVLRRLESVGLGHLVLDLHGAGISRKVVMGRIKRALEVIERTVPVDAAECHREFAKNRERLNAHVQRLHAPHPPSGLSAFDIKGEILCTPEAARMDARWRGAALEKLDQEISREAEDLFDELRALEGLFLRNDPSPWTGANLPDGERVREALDIAAALGTEQWPSLRDELETALAATGLEKPGTFAEGGQFAKLLRDIGRSVETYGEGIHAEDLDALTEGLAPAKGGHAAALWAFITDAEYRTTRSRLRELRRRGAASGPRLVRELDAMIAERDAWKKIAPGSLPRAAANAKELLDSVDRVASTIRRISEILGRPDLADHPLDQLETFIRGLANDGVTPHRIPRLLDIERRLTSLGLGNLIRELCEKGIPADLWRTAFRHAWLSSCLDRVWAEDPTLAAFSGKAHDAYVGTFRTRDKERLELAADRVRRMHAEHVVRIMNEHRDQDTLIRAEANKKTRHISLRKLLERAPDVLTALFPCWMASPLSVSQLLGGDRRYFDVALFDEASQVPPEDAISSIMRSDRLVVAGDRHQLPPTAFFADGAVAPAEGEDDGGVTDGFESMLDAMDAFLPSWMLEWHYRSRDEALIAFSNRHIYNDRLVTFPGPGRTPAITHVHVDHAPGRDGQEDSASEEVKGVVELILRHAEERPEETLGVIALGLKHARRIQMELDQILPLRRDLEEFFDQSREERFFVKNLERVQGDERDAIILSVGYGKDRAGNLPYRFGPILQNGGERRLNVAVTRARSRMTLVSSFTHHDMDAGRSSAKGVEFLRLYLQYAASGGDLLGDAGEAPIPLNAFEADIKDALEAHGVPLIPQFGCSRYRIDLVAQHPTKPGRLVLAYECDGASYHSSPTARDRDRLRQQILEGLGWQFHRIWSTDWFTRRDEQIKRAVEAYQRAVTYADELDARGAGIMAPGRSPTPEVIAEAESMDDGTPSRGPRPGIPVRRNITEYSSRELKELIRWIRSDGRLRTDEQIIAELVRELGFSRRGHRIVEAIRGAIAQVN